MSKKKNTLKDLDEFLKQQAASLVTPEKLPDESETAPIASGDTSTTAKSETFPSVLEALKQLSTTDNNFREKFYQMIIDLYDTGNFNHPEDKMMINTALYLKSGDNWKEAIRQYWKKKA